MKQRFVLSAPSSCDSTSAASIALSSLVSNHVLHSFTFSSPSCFNLGSWSEIKFNYLLRIDKYFKCVWCNIPISIESLNFELIEMTPLENFCHCSLSGNTSFNQAMSGRPSFHSSYFYKLKTQEFFFLLLIQKDLYLVESDCTTNSTT